MPEVFCGWSWDDFKDMQPLQFHGNFQWFDEAEVSVGWCMDGLRPVVKIERIYPSFSCA
jgi:hypothetical protein